MQTNKIIVQRTKFSRNFGPPDQSFRQTKISMTVPPCMVFGDHYYLQLGDYFYNSIGVLQQADVEQATQNGKLATRLVPHLKTHHGYVLFLYFRLKTSSSYIYRWVNSMCAHRNPHMLTTFPNLGYIHCHHKLHPSQREEEGSSHTATIELSLWQKVELTNQVVLFVDCPHCHRVYSHCLIPHCTVQYCVP